ncbi:MAG: substrate-binding domain-containing protein [Campylobacterota bacterium]|nr:substrate-binding domain-containing protein [Campylobacterota bacterium]
MKKILLVILLVVTSLYSKEYKVGFAQDTLANDWRVAQVDEVKNEIKKYPYLKLTVKDAKASVANQIADIEYFINNDYDFIITSPINARITSLVLNKALKKGIKVILISRSITSQDYTTFIAPKNKFIGEQIGKYMVEKLNGKGTILMLQGVKGTTSARDRENGFDEIVKNYPNIKVIKKRANYLRADAIQVMEDIYKKDIKFDAIYSHSDSMLSGVRSVMQRYNKNNTILMVGIDYITEAKNAILKGVQTASFTYPTCGKEGVDAIVKIIQNKQFQRDRTIPSTMITIGNVKDVNPIF